MSKLKKTVLHIVHAGVNPTNLLHDDFRRKIASDATDPDITGLLGNKYNSIGRQVAPAILSLIPGVGTAIAAGYTALNNYGQGGSIGSSLAKGALSYGASKLGQAIGNGSLTGASSAPTAGSGVLGGGTGAASSAYGTAAGGAYDAVDNAAIDGIGSGFNNASSAAIGNTAGSTVGSTLGNSAGNVGGATALTSTAGNTVANSSGSLLGSLAKYGQIASPIVSAGLGTYSNLAAKDALLSSEKANQKLLQPFLDQQFNPGDLTQDPGYQFQLEQGQQAQNRLNAARGNYASGEALTDAQKFGQGLAGTTYNDAYQRFLANQGQKLSAATGLAGINNDIGNTKAGSITGLGNLLSATGGSLLGGSSYGNQGQLLGQGSSGLTPELLAYLSRQNSGARY